MLAAQIGVDLTDEHWKVIRFLRDDYQAKGETATTRRVQAVGGVPTKEQFDAVPEEAGQEDGLHRRSAQAARLRVNGEPR